MTCEVNSVWFLRFTLCFSSILISTLLATVLTFLLVSPLHNIYFVLHKRFLRHSVSISRMKPMPGDDSLTGPWSLDFKKKQKSSKIRVHCWIKVVSSRALLLRKSLHYWIVKELSSVYFHLHLSSFQHIQFIPSGHWWSFIKGMALTRDFGSKSRAQHMLRFIFSYSMRPQLSRALHF